MEKSVPLTEVYTLRVLWVSSHAAARSTSVRATGLLVAFFFVVMQFRSCTDIIVGIFELLVIADVVVFAFSGYAHFLASKGCSESHRTFLSYLDIVLGRFLESSPAFSVA